MFIKNIDEYIQDSSVELEISEHLSEEFRPEDVWLGHSYFIKEKDSDFNLGKSLKLFQFLKNILKTVF